MVAEFGVYVCIEVQVVKPLVCLGACGFGFIVCRGCGFWSFWGFQVFVQGFKV